MTMIETPGLLTETPSVGAPAEHSDALIADLLARVRLSGALFLRGRYSAPWAFESPGNCDLAELLTPDAERLLVFHTVRSGSIKVMARGMTVEGHAGDMIVLPHADRHVMSSRADAEAIKIADVLPPPPWKEIPVVEFGGGGEAAEIVCGYFRCDELLFNAVLRRLPPLIVVRPEGSVARLLNAAVDYALEDGSRSGGITAMDHVTEMLLREALRLYAGEGGESGGWLTAANDPVVGRALKLIHDDPERDWSADGLARAANTSRSVLGDRFRTLLGQSPIRYLVEWRMQIAADLLRSSELKLATVAERVGYGSEAAFSRAFRRHVGQAPAEWRGRVANGN